MHRNLLASAAILAMLATGIEAHAACTAANPNANVAESTPTSAFTDHGNGTVTHSLTGLMWKQCAEGLSGAGCATGAATAMTWGTALAAAKNANFADHSDWRLPNKKELESIVELCGYNPNINQDIFPATPASYFWSGSSYVPDPPNAWVVYFSSGNTYAGSKSLDGYVRLVRGGQTFDSFDSQSNSAPDIFTFTAQTGVTPSSVATSDTITVSGINSAANISIAGGEYAVSTDSGANWSAWSATVPATVNLNDQVKVRQTSSGSYGTLTTAILTIGGVGGAFQVTTLNLAVSSIAVDPAAPTTLYTGLDDAGVYKSTDGSASWSAASTQPANTRIKALVIKPGDSAALFAATYGGGVFKSSDSGTNWSACATQPANLNLLSLTMDAAGKLYAGSEAGVFVSSDGCASWTAMNAGLPL